MSPEHLPHFFDFDRAGLREFCVAQGMPAFVGDQLLKWVYGKGVTDFAGMTNVSAGHKARLAGALCFHRSTLVTEQRASDGTCKLLLGWDRSAGALPQVDGDEKRTETVMIPDGKRRTACVSSQVGCPVGCRFCASGLGGLEGNLTAGQIVEQVARLGAAPGADRITNVVFMGMGEPLANYDAVTSAIRTLNAPWATGVGARRITVSTVGLPAAIRRLAGFELPVTLALSLHAPNDEIRRKLIPWAEYAPIAELLDACDEYFQATGREITLEYLLMRGVNDRIEHAEQLADLAGRLRANVNLIRYNEVRGLPYDRPTTEDVRRFQSTLRSRHVAAHIRASRGRDIAAACGQLRHERRGLTR